MRVTEGWSSVTELEVLCLSSSDTVANDCSLFISEFKYNFDNFFSDISSVNNTSAMKEGPVEPVEEDSNARVRRAVMEDHL